MSGGLERVTMDPEQAGALVDRYRRAALIVEDAAADLVWPLTEADRLVGSGLSAVAAATDLADDLMADAGDLAWRREHLVASDALVLRDGCLTGELPSGWEHDRDATLVWSTILGSLRQFDRRLGPVYVGERDQPAPRYEEWPPDTPRRFDLSDDACSSPVGNTPWGFDFTLACQKHDFGYRNLRRLDERLDDGAGTSWNESTRAVVDDQFAEDLAVICEPEEGLDARACGSAAEAYVEAVRFGGDGIQLHDGDEAVETLIDYLWPF